MRSLHALFKNFSKAANSMATETSAATCNLPGSSTGHRQQILEGIQETRLTKNVVQLVDNELISCHTASQDFTYDVATP